MITNEIERRTVLRTAAIGLMAATGGGVIGNTQAQAASEGASTKTTQFTVNRRAVSLDLDPRTTLLGALREHLYLTGTTKGCDQGRCGACTVLVDGRRINGLPYPRGHAGQGGGHHH